MITNEKEALMVACAMEERAIELYQRALLVVKNPDALKQIKELLEDEQEHLLQFKGFLEEYDEKELTLEKTLLLKAYGGGVLFKGGLVAAQREGALESAEKLLQYAFKEEEKAYEKYMEFSKMATNGKAKNMFMTIAEEEKMHKIQLQKQLESLV